MTNRVPAVQSSGSVCVIYGPMGLPFFSSRDMECTFEPIKEHEQLERNINSTLIDLSIPGLFEKYMVTLQCTDGQAPMIGGVWQGMEVTIDCPNQLAYPSSVSVPPRPLALGTSVEDDGNGTKRIYPRLVCLIRKMPQSFREYPSKYSWTLGLEEK